MYSKENCTQDEPSPASVIPLDYRKVRRNVYPCLTESKQSKKEISLGVEKISSGRDS